MPTESASPRIAIIGAGFSGLCLGIELAKRGFHDFTIFEKSDHIGGTWRDNTYPGAACDSPSFAYCFSFEQKTDWSRKWAPQPEILDYIDHCAEKYGITPHVRLRTEIASATFDEAAGVWRLETTGGERTWAHVLVSGVGQLNRPRIPAIPGIGRFRGPCFHSARWDHDVPLDGRRVAVVGNAASAVQLVPEIARRASALYVFQRSANWMMPKLDREYGEATRRRFTRHPWLAKLYRWWIWANFEMRFPVFRKNRFLSRRLEKLAIREMRKVVRDPELQEALIPDYPIGGKRILISDDYYQTLNRDHVSLVTEGIDRLEEDAVVTAGGRRIPVDAVIFATGFETTSFLAPMRVEGRGGRRLVDDWKDGARAYLGMTLPGYPNFFMMYGPNTNLGHNSIIFMIECQAGYIAQCVERIAAAGLATLELRPEVLERFDARLRRELSRTAWAATDHSWYKNDAGVITNNWSGTTTRYWWRTRHPDFSEYQLRWRPAARATAPGPSPEAGDDAVRSQSA